MNPLLAPSPLPDRFPDFAAIREEHFAEAFDVAMAEQRAEIAAITTLPGPPTFDDTVVAPVSYTHLTLPTTPYV